MNFISTIFGIPLGWIMWLIYAVVKNYGIALLIFTVLVRVGMFPLAIKTQKTTAKTQLLSPKIEKLRQKYGNNKEKLQEETMKLYNEEGVNPMGGCGPALIQMPIFFGIVDVVRRPLTHICRISKDILETASTLAKDFLASSGGEVSARFDYQAEIEIMKLAKTNPEVFSSLPAEQFEKIANFDNNFMGIDFGLIPSFKPEVWTLTAVILVLVPILTGVLQMLMSFIVQRNQKKNNPSAPSMGNMNLLLYGMNIFFVVTMFAYPFGLTFYFFISAIMSVVQQVVMHKIYTPERIAEMVEKERAEQKKAGRKSFMERLYEQQQQALEYQQNGGRVVRTTAEEVDDDDDDDDEEASDGEEKPKKKKLDPDEIKLTKAQHRSMEKQIISEARRRMAEKYGDDYSDED